MSDQFVVNTTGRLISRYEREFSSSIFHGGTLYNDAATSIIWVENKVYLEASETVLEKDRLNNGFGRKCVLIHLTCIVKSVFLCLMNSVWTVTTNIKSNISLDLEHIIRTQDRKE